MLDKISLVLVIIGAINWALIGIFQFDLVAYLFGGQAAVVSRIVYTIVGAAGLWCISLLFGERVADVERTVGHAARAAADDDPALDVLVGFLIIGCDFIKIDRIDGCGTHFIHSLPDVTDWRLFLPR